MRFNLILILFLTLPIAVFGQRWTLDECIRYAVDNSTETAIQKESNNIRKQNYKQAIANLLPSLEISSNANFSFGRTLDDDNTYRDVNSFSNPYSLSTSLTLFDGLSSINNIKLEKYNRLVGKEELEKKIVSVAYETMKAFLNVQYYQELVVLSRDQLEESSSNVKQMEAMTELGMKSFPELAEVQAQQAQNQYTLTRNKNLLTIALIKLKEQMNFPIDEDLEIEEYISFEPIDKTEESAAEIYASSVSYLPEALLAKYSLEASKMSYKAAKGSLYPRLSMGAGMNTNYYKYISNTNAVEETFVKQLQHKRGEYFAFYLTIPIFNRFTYSSNVKRSKYNLNIERYKTENTLRSLYSTIEQAVADMNGKADEYYQAKKQVEAMTLSHNLYLRKFEEGLSTALEVHTSANRLLQAQVEEKNAQLMFYMYRKLVNYYKGEPFISEF